MAESVLTSRDRILGLVAAQPGLHLRELPRRLGLSLRTVRYHLETMVDEDLVTPHRSERFARWFRAGAFTSTERGLISALRVGGQRAILEHLLSNGPTRFATLQRALPLSSATLAHYLTRLSEERLVDTGADRLYRLHAPEATRIRVADYRDRFPDLLADAAREIFDETL